MVIIRDEVELTLNNDENTNIDDIVSGGDIIIDDEILDKNFIEDAESESICLDTYNNTLFTKVIITSNLEDIDSIGVIQNNDYFLLLGQEKIEENGLYKFINSQAIRQVPQENTYYYSRSKIGLYHKNINQYMLSHSKKLYMKKTFVGSTAEQTIFDIPTLKNSHTKIELEIVGHSNNFGDHISIDNKQRFLSGDPTVVPLGDFGSDVTRGGTNTLFSSLPDIKYDINDNLIILKITPNTNTSTNWIIKAVIHV